MRRPRSLSLALGSLTVMALMASAWGVSCAAPKAVAVEDFKNDTGDRALTWLEFQLPSALVECLWQLPRVARGPDSACDPQPHAQSWVYRMTESDTWVRSNPLSGEVRSLADSKIAKYLAQPNPLDLPAEPHLRVTGVLEKKGDALALTITLATAAGHGVRNISLSAPVDEAVLTLSSEAAQELAPFLSSAAKGAPAPSLGTHSAEAARAYLESVYIRRLMAAFYLMKLSESRGAEAPSGGMPLDEALAPAPYRALYSGHDIAIHYLKQAISLDAKFALPHTALGILYAQHAWPPSGGIGDKNALTAAREEFEAAVRLGDTSPTAVTGLAAALFGEGQASLSSGDAEGAKASWEKSRRAWLRALELEPDSAPTLRSAANAYFKLALDMTGKTILDPEAFEAGLTLLRKAVKLAPKCEQATAYLRGMESLKSRAATQ